MRIRIAAVNGTYYPRLTYPPLPLLRNTIRRRRHFFKNVPSHYIPARNTGVLLANTRSTQQKQNMCITFVQGWTNVEDVGPTLYKCYSIFLCLLLTQTHIPDNIANVLGLLSLNRVRNVGMNTWLVGMAWYVLSTRKLCIEIPY